MTKLGDRYEVREAAAEICDRLVDIIHPKFVKQLVAAGKVSESDALFDKQLAAQEARIEIQIILEKSLEKLRDVLAEKQAAIDERLRQTVRLSNELRVIYGMPELILSEWRPVDDG